MVRKIISEFIGTLLLVIFGCGTAIVVQSSAINIIGVIATSLSFGIILMILSLFFGDISGCHVNPAVSIAMLLDKRITLIECICYVIAQFSGAICGAFMLNFMITDMTNAACNYLCDGDFFKTVVVEMVLTSVFVLSVLVTTDKKHASAATPVYIGMSLTLTQLIGIGLDGGGVNPARSFGAMAIYSWSTMSSYIPFVAGPVLGAVISWVMYKLLIAEKKAVESEPSEKPEKHKKSEKKAGRKEKSKKETDKETVSEQKTVQEQEQDYYEESGIPSYEEPVYEEPVESVQSPVPVDDTVYEDSDGNRYYLYTDGNYYPIQ